MKIATNEIHGGQQHLHRFPNHYGASVVRHEFSYGSDAGKWELAVVRFHSDAEKDFTLVYDTPITSDVEGCLSDEEVEALLAKIEALPAK